MRIEKLNKDKIKVTLTTAELINLDIDVKRLSPDSKELHTLSNVEFSYCQRI